MRKNDLERRGWTKDEIKEAEILLEKARHHDVHFSKIVFWSALFVIILGNISLSLVLIPFLLVFQPWVLHTLVIIVALMTGSIYSFLVLDIGHLEQKYHIIASIIVPILAIINLVVMVFVANSFAKEISASQQLHNQWLVAAIFAAAFILPFLIHRLWRLIKR